MDAKPIEFDFFGNPIPTPKTRLIPPEISKKIGEIEADGMPQPVLRIAKLLAEEFPLPND